MSLVMTRRRVKSFSLTVLAESPKGRRSVCYDRAALDSRKEHKPANSAADMATVMGIELLTEEEYRELQTRGEFDLKSSSWVKTPADIRKLGGAIYCDRRYNHVFAVSQRGGVLLCRSRIPRLAQGVTSQRCSRCGGCLRHNPQGSRPPSQPRIRRMPSLVQSLLSVKRRACGMSRARRRQSLTGSRSTIGHA